MITLLVPNETKPEVTRQKILHAKTPGTDPLWESQVVFENVPAFAKHSQLPDEPLLAMQSHAANPSTSIVNVQY